GRELPFAADQLGPAIAKAGLSQRAKAIVRGIEASAGRWCPRGGRIAMAFDGLKQQPPCGVVRSPRPHREGDAASWREHPMHFRERHLRPRRMMHAEI